MLQALYLFGGFSMRNFALRDWTTPARVDDCVPVRTSANLGSRSTLKFEMEDLQDKIALALMRGAKANDPDQGRRDATDAYHSARSTRTALGRADRSRVSKEEGRAVMDLEALDLISGRTQPPKPQRKSSAERAADNAGLDDLDRKALALVHGEIGEPEIEQPNAEAVLEQVT